MHKIRIWIYKNKKLLIIIGCMIAVVVGLLTFVVPQPVKLNYSGETCVKRLIVLPGLYRSADGDYYVEYKKTLNVGSLPLLAATVCVTPSAIPEEGVSSAGLALFGWPWLQQRLTVNSGKLARIDVAPLAKPIAFSKPLTLLMDTTDNLFEYKLTVNNKTIRCSSSIQKLECPVAEAGIKPSQQYTYTLSRYFKSTTAGKIRSGNLTTLNAVQLIEASIAPGSTVYDKPRSFTVSFDKQIIKARATLHKVAGDDVAGVDSSDSLDGKSVTLIWPKDLDREAVYEIRVTDLEASDGSSLVEPYVSRFTVAGGPKVSNVSVPKIGVPVGAQVVVTFDQPLNSTQDIVNLVTVSGLPATVVRSGAQVMVKLQSSATCADFTIQVKPGLLSEHGIQGKEPWSFSGRTICHTVGTIGYSSRGRAISAYYFGSGATSVLYVGAIHGNEASSSYLLRDWIDFLENNAKKIPADRQIVVVPTLNPDGFAASTRNSATNVNLNRNFATTDWKKDIKDTSGTVAGGGGSEPMSEPETKAIAALSSRLRPRLTLSYHAVGSVAIANGAGASSSAAAAYASAVGYNNGTGNSAEIFQYEITGTYDDWLAQNLGLGSVVVELGSYQYRNFSHHSAAMWNMATR